jgi:hypothetical protein
MYSPCILRTGAQSLLCSNAAKLSFRLSASVIVRKYCEHPVPEKYPGCDYDNYKFEYKKEDVERIGVIGIYANDTPADIVRGNYIDNRTPAFRRKADKLLVQGFPHIFVCARGKPVDSLRVGTNCTDVTYSWNLVERMTGKIVITNIAPPDFIYSPEP